MTRPASRSCRCACLPRSTGAKNADGSPGPQSVRLRPRAQFPFTAAALATDNELGAAIATSLTVYNTPGVPAQRHQCGRLPAAGPAGLLAIRARCFRRHARDRHHAHRPGHRARSPRASGSCAATANQPGDTTLWGEEFTGQINNKGTFLPTAPSPPTRITASASPWAWMAAASRNGWYGGAFTFYSRRRHPGTCRAPPAPTPNGTCSPAIPTGAASTSSSIPRSAPPMAISIETRTLSVGDVCPRPRPAAVRAPCWRWAPIPA